MIERYPEVLPEMQTLDLVCSGRSIARYGDGEFKVVQGGAAKAQAADQKLSDRLRHILADSGECLVGIPNIHEVMRSHTVDQKLQFWGRYLVTSRLLVDRPYVSSFITRLDSAPWLDVPEYWTKLESLWKGKDVTLVRGSGKSLTADDLSSAGRVTEIICPRQHAFAEYKQILGRIGKPKTAILCLGPTATAMAVDLCAKGVHAIDLGHGGMFWRKHLRGEPMWLTKDDKVPA